MNVIFSTFPDRKQVFASSAMISRSLQTLLLFVTAYARFAHARSLARSKLLDDPREVSRQRMYWINLLTPPDVVKRLQHAAGIALSRESSCVPTGGLLLTYSNEYHAPFMELTRRGLHRSSPDCNVLLRAVAVCFGHSNSSICVQAPAAAASDHRKRQYHEIIWIKWNIIDFVFQVPGCEVVFFFDADVVLFQNPFLAIEAGLHAPLSQLDFGIMYQPTGPWEGAVVRHPAMPIPAPPSQTAGGAAVLHVRRQHDAASKGYGRPICGDVTTVHRGHEVNGGQVLVRSRDLLQIIVDARPLVFHASSQLDQQTVSKILRLQQTRRSVQTSRTVSTAKLGSVNKSLPFFSERNRYHACLLPEGFTEHCWCRNNVTCAVDSCSMVSYHATCLSTFSYKYAGALAAIERFEHPACQRWRLKHPLRPPRLREALP